MSDACNSSNGWYLRRRRKVPSPGVSSLLPAPGDEDLEVLIGSELPSDTTAKCVYRILSRVGEGAMGIAFYAMRISAEGECGVVVKILRPWFVQQWGKTAELIVQKEAVALGRLNERVRPPPSSSD